MRKSLDIHRFLDKVNKTSTCWLWTAARKKLEGYGFFYLNGKLMGAHRASYILFKGPIDPTLHISHTCDVTHCVNPDHLIQCTRSSNMLHKYERGRDNQSKAFKRKLTDGDIIKILASGDSLKEIAWTYGVTASYIGALRNGNMKSSISRRNRAIGVGIN